MKVLIAGEFSGIVRDAFAERGHDAWSCDYRSSERKGNHIQGSWFEHDTVNAGWDLIIAHPDCTFLAVSGARWMSVEWREEAQLAALHTVKAIWKFPVKKLAIENPVGKLSSLWRGPDQIIQPSQFGDPFRKATCLWLRGLPQLVPTNDLGGGEQACWKEPPSPERKKNRARTYPGIADAMAEQWGGVSLAAKIAQALNQFEAGAALPVPPAPQEKEPPDNALKIACAELAGYRDGFEGLPLNATYATGDENLAYQLWFNKAQKVRAELVDQIDTLSRLLERRMTPLKMSDLEDAIDIPEVREARKALRCLYITVEAEVADDVVARVEDALKALALRIIISAKSELEAAVLALDPAAADTAQYGEWDAAKWKVFNEAVRFVKYYSDPSSGHQTAAVPPAPKLEKK